MEDRLHIEPRDAPSRLRGLEEESREPEEPKKKAKKKAVRKRIAQEGKEKQRKLEQPQQEQRLSESAGPRAEENSASSENLESYERPETPKSTETGENESIHHRELKQEPLRTAEREPPEPQLYTRQKQKEAKRKQISRLRFEDEPLPAKGEGKAAPAVRLAASVPRAAVTTAHEKVGETEDENSAVQAAHQGEQLAEQSLSAAERKLQRDSAQRKREVLQQKNTKLEHAAAQPASKLSFEAERAPSNQAQQVQMQKAAQKRRIKRQYAESARRVSTGAEAAAGAVPRPGIPEKLRNRVREFARENRGLVAIVAAAGVLVILFAGIFSAFSGMVAETEGALMETTYLAEDQAIWDAEALYAGWEAELQHQIEQIRAEHPGYDEYRFQIDEISHNPYQLISYLTLKCGAFHSADVKSEMESLFREQYSLSFQEDSYTETSTRMVRVGESLGSVVTSGYCNCAICCGVWAGCPTASGLYPRAQHTIAVDGSNPFVPMGTHVVMNGVEYVVEDIGGFAGFGVQFDVYYDTHAQAQAHGHQTWEAVLADSNGRREVEVTESHTVRRLSVTLSNRNLDLVIRNRLNEEDTSHYQIYNAVYGNRSYLFSVENLPSYGGMSYDIPPEALSDSRFAAMIREAEKYLGRPYVWGGGSPETGFDCSGYVSWVVNHCGNGWDFGRLSAEGLRGVCTYVSPQEARPGDLVFFQGTYDTPGASHCAIYVGDGMMIHCGNPIQYASMQSSYWQEHFFCFGRLP